MDDEKFLRYVDWALGKWRGEGAQEALKFGREAGKPVPAVDPEDVKTVWQIGREAQANHPGQNVAIGGDLMRHACKPEADIEAVGYRSSLLWLVNRVAPEQMAQFTREGEPNDAAFRAVAKIPAEWAGVGIVREGLPFDLREFFRLCDEN
jgi:hypothetical protein